ncbi:hypothetical protein [Flavisolibacter tropicus]|uniref:3-keto-disaccharide hydrolase domain-containing protein n=1 Tax=Flavisolibacter tropicus TaxID=1492898 RepID=A0A172TYS9_9BACT|nr:hypothetical protein [Flavisolibacter tropicus]ANE52156.1 hypothetical protein SY85_18315 [Flavisolibacter tropicus]
MNLKLLLSATLSVFLFLNVNGQTKQAYILKEDFNNNTLGWTEEFTKAHRTEIKEGSLYITSLDTSKYQSSNGPQNVSFLWNLPKSFEITSSFQVLDNSLPATFGILLYSTSLNYRFAYSETAEGLLSEYDYNREEEATLFSKNTHTPDIVSLKTIPFKIKVNDRKAQFYVNNVLIGEEVLKAKSWSDIRLFTTSGAAIKVDYLYIQ